MRLDMTPMRKQALIDCAAMQEKIDVLHFEKKEKTAHAGSSGSTHRSVQAFGNWHKNVFKPQTKELNKKIKKLMDQYGIFTFKKDNQVKYGIRE